MMLDGRGGAINDTQRQYLRVVTENTNRLINAVTWMSHMSEPGMLHFQLDSFDLRKTWTECVEAVQPVLRERALKLSEKIPSEEFVITGDREKLTSVITELLKVAARVSGI